MYQAMATSMTPALIIYLIDVSGSMDLTMPTKDGPQRKIDILPKVIRKAAKKMVQRSTKGEIISPRYRVAMFAYSNTVTDLYPGVKTIDAVAQVGVPKNFTPQNATDTYSGFLKVKELLQKEIPLLPKGSPAPLICHLTDGEYTTQDPTPIVNQIMAMSVDDGSVLVENVFISERLLVSTQEVTQWEGYTPGNDLGTPYANNLLMISSPLPEAYRENIVNEGYNIQPGTRMMYPGIDDDFVSLAFVMSTMTKVDAASRDR